MLVSLGQKPTDAEVQEMISDVTCGCLAVLCIYQCVLL